MSNAERWVAALVACAVLTIGVALIAIWPMVAIAFDGKRSGKAFYVASESIWPTLQMNDRVVPRAIADPAIRRGMVVAIQASDSVRLYRVADIEGDRIGLRAGHIVLNGLTIPLRSKGRSTKWERMPGETGMHQIADLGHSQGDDFDAVLVPPGKLFLLGDNRDRSADSRYDFDVMGVGLVDRTSVIGMVDVVLSRVGWRWQATPVDGR